MPANLGKVIRYPEDLIDHATDYFQIEVLEQPPTKGLKGLTQDTTGTVKEDIIATEDVLGENGEVKFKKGDVTGQKDVQKTGTSLNFYQGGKAVMASDRYKNLKTKNVIILPIPQNIKDNNGANWGESKLNDFAAAGISAVGRMMDSTNILKQGVEEVKGLVGNAKSGKGDGLIDFAKTTAAASAVNTFGANVTAEGLIARATGQVINQNLEMVFGGVTIRSFNFSWDLVPRSIDEAQVVKKMIRTLKIASAAKYTADNMGFLNAPDIFRLNYMKGGQPHPFLHKFKTCALKNMSVNYTGSGTWATYGDGTPVHMKLDLAFTEMNPIYAEDHEGVSKGGFY